MIKFKETVTYITATEEEADAAIVEARKDTRFDLVGTKITYKEKKEKGEIVDTHYLLELKKQYCQEW